MAAVAMEASAADLAELGGVLAQAGRWVVSGLGSPGCRALEDEVLVPGLLPLAPSLAAVRFGDSTLFAVIGLFPTIAIIAADSSSAELDGCTRIIAVGPIIGVRGAITTKISS
jgi:hypothetical protein